MGDIRRKHSAAFKTRVVLELLKEEKSLAQVCSAFSVHPTQARAWRQRAVEGLRVIFTNGVKTELAQKDELIDGLYAEIGRAKTELDWLKKKIGA